MINNNNIELLRQMVRTSEEALNKERAKTTTRKTDNYRALNDQLCFIKFCLLNKSNHYFYLKVKLFKTPERQLKSKVESLTNEIALLKRRLIDSKNQTNKKIFSLIV
jgi:hypothetical protein